MKKKRIAFADFLCFSSFLLSCMGKKHIIIAVIIAETIVSTIKRDNVII